MLRLPAVEHLPFVLQAGLQLQPHLLQLVNPELELRVSFTLLAVPVPRPQPLAAPMLRLKWLVMINSIYRFAAQLPQQQVARQRPNQDASAALEVVQNYHSLLNYLRRDIPCYH